MTPPTAPLQFLQAFRQKLLSVFPMRADALFELVDALLLTVDPRSPVELSASPAFRRRFSMVYDALRQGQIDPAAARELLAEAEPAEAMTVAGYAVYATDGTVHPRPDADTLPDRGQVYSTSQGRTVPGHQYNWLGRIVAHGRSWFAPRDVERIATRTTPAAVAAEQVKRLGGTPAPGGVGGGRGGSGPAPPRTAKPPSRCSRPTCGSVPGGRCTSKPCRRWSARCSGSSFCGPTVNRSTSVRSGCSGAGRMTWNWPRWSRGTCSASALSIS